MSGQNHLVHWADNTADRIIRQKGDKDTYVVASGITPSGVVHFGNFREVITVDLVARALRSRGKKVRFIFSWDNYDTFRKIPVDMPNQELLKKHLFQPIVDTPDPHGVEENYASASIKSFESQLEKVGIEVDFLYQADKYRNREYVEGIATTLKNTDTVRKILDQHRKEPLAKDWLPLSVYCDGCNTDNKITNLKWDGENALSYHCDNCTSDHTIDLKTTTKVKLPWREDWPMRWAFEKVDFEPGGKDHSSQGGSYTTAKELAAEVYSYQPPVYLQYDFVSVKGGGGKMSSSAGNVITVNDVLKVYEPEMVRWIFASYKTNVDFSISFDLDVLKTYEDFDRQERLAYGLDLGNEKKTNMAKRVLELSQVGQIPEVCPIQPSFRHLCNILQINDFNIDVAKKYYADSIKSPRDQRRFEQRSECAKFWIENYAPDEFKFQINKGKIDIEMNDVEKSFVTNLKDVLGSDWDKFETDKDLHEKMYEIIHTLEVKPAEVFPVMYKHLINREKGPKLAGFIKSIGKERVISLL
ncbi:MAG: lysine--tRNA ligase [Bacteriovoracaceae bacterium]|nr:lysine--tRNA ligase [Bacteriovoracaceae bacterium]